MYILGILTLLFNYLGTPLPDNSFIEISYGDNTTEVYDFQVAMTLTHTYASDGHYKTVVRIWNDAGEIIREVPVCI